MVYECPLMGLPLLLNCDKFETKVKSRKVMQVFFRFNFRLLARFGPHEIRSVTDHIVAVETTSGNKGLYDPHVYGVKQS